MIRHDESRTPNPESRLADLIRDRGPLTVAAFMDYALYDPENGYYARAARRSGRAGDFFTSVDVGPLFGELLEIQLAEMADILGGHTGPPLHDVGADPRVGPFDLVEAGAGNGRLSADILGAARERDPHFYDAIRLHLVEASGEARRAQTATLGDTADRLASSGASLPSSFEGVLIANELLDAMPVHQVVMREQGLKEVYIDVGGPGMPALRTIEGPPSTPALAEHLAHAGAELQSGWRVEINLRAVEWIRDAARRLRRGFIIVIDYGHDARELYSPTHAAGTLTSFRGHRSAGPESSAATPPWLQSPGEQDITSHVDFTSLRAAAESDGLQTLGFLDQTYFLLGLIEDRNVALNGSRDDAALNGPRYDDNKRRRALKTLVMPGGLGSTFKVMIFGKGAGTPALRGCSYRMRVT
jgi:SAM-dependent MidA family methyltransferase